MLTRTESTESIIAYLRFFEVIIPVLVLVHYAHVQVGPDTAVVRCGSDGSSVTVIPPDAPNRCVFPRRISQQATKRLPWHAVQHNRYYIGCQLLIDFAHVPTGPDPTIASLPQSPRLICDGVELQVGLGPLWSRYSIAFSPKSMLRSCSAGEWDPESKTHEVRPSGVLVPTVIVL